MKPYSRAALFCISVVSLYALFAWPWPPVESGYSRWFARCATAVLGVKPGGAPTGIYGTNAVVLVYSKFDEDPEHDIDLVIGNLATFPSPDGLTSKPHTSSRHLGYMPAAALAALVLATPVSWKRRLWALFWGMLWVHAFVALRFAFVLLGLFHGKQPFCLFYWDSPLDRILNEACNILVVVPSTTYVVPLIIWLATTFRREDLERVMSQFQPPIEPTPG